MTITLVFKFKMTRLDSRFIYIWIFRQADRKNPAGGYRKHLHGEDYYGEHSRIRTSQYVLERKNCKTAVYYLSLICNSFDRQIRHCNIFALTMILTLPQISSVSLHSKDYYVKLQTCNLISFSFLAVADENRSKHILPDKRKSLNPSLETASTPR